MKDQTQLFTVKPAEGEMLPMLISCPHSGTEFPEEIKAHFKKEVVDRPTDTDWFVDQLYDFAPSLGITLICANLSRYVVDLNRDPESRALYNDGRKETSVVPLKTFEQKDIYKETPPTREEIQRRLDCYYWPYYQKIRSLLEDLQKKFKNVLFFDAHSIPRVVKTIQDEAFSDLILGDQDKKTADVNLIDCALKTLNSASYQVAHNDPFKGGHLTRSFACLQKGIHCLQLEMSQDVYMDVNSCQYVETNKIRPVLQQLFKNLNQELRGLK